MRISCKRGRKYVSESMRDTMRSSPTARRRGEAGDTLDEANDEAPFAKSSTIRSSSSERRCCARIANMERQYRSLEQLTPWQRSTTSNSGKLESVLRTSVDAACFNPQRRKEKIKASQRLNSFNLAKSNGNGSLLMSSEQAVQHI